MDFPPYNEMLIDRRRQLGLTIQQAAQELNMREEVLAAFEDADFEQMPKSGYGQAMLSSYARFLGLDPMEVISSYTQSHEQYRRGSRRRTMGMVNAQRSYSSQEPAPRRPFGPSLGGWDGDTGVFATTRSRSRGLSYDEVGQDGGDEYDAYDNDDGAYAGGNLGGSYDSGAYGAGRSGNYGRGNERSYDREPMGSSGYDRGYGREPAASRGYDRDYGRESAPRDFGGYDRDPYEQDPYARRAYGAEAYGSYGSSRMDDTRFDSRFDTRERSYARSSRRDVGYDADRRRGEYAPPADYALGTSSYGSGRRSASSVGSRSRREDPGTRTARRRSSSSGYGASRRESQRMQGGLGRPKHRQRPLRQLVADHLEAILFVLAAAVVVGIVLSVSSCIRTQTEEAKTVPVSSAEASSKEKTSTGTTSSSSSTQDSSSSEEDEMPSDDDGGDATAIGDSGDETSVTVMVADGAVTWLSVECDGQIKVSETTTGPWQETYTVGEALTVQAGDTSAVSVVRDGRQIQFESESGGIGSLRIQGSGKKATDDDEDGSSARTGNATKGTDSSDDTED